jgi:hypothetical protein
MHGGFLLARCEWTDLRRAIESHCGPLTDEGPVSQADWSRPPHGEDVYHVTSDGECCYVLDRTMVLSGLADTIVALSGQLSCEVIGAGAETVSGTFWFTAARKGRLSLLHYDQKVALTEPLRMGGRLPTEEAHPFDDADGKGIVAGIVPLGFSATVLLQGTADGGTRYRWAAKQFPDSGPVEERIRKHCEAHKRADADDWPDRVTVIRRGACGFDLRGW